jgi:predicted nuclease with TOPRIM domain
MADNDEPRQLTLPEALVQIEDQQDAISALVLQREEIANGAARQTATMAKLSRRFNQLQAEFQAIVGDKAAVEVERDSLKKRVEELEARIAELEAPAGTEAADTDKVAEIADAPVVAAPTDTEVPPSLETVPANINGSGKRRPVATAPF